MDEILAYARELALKDYDIIVTATVSNGTIFYLASSPELQGCVAQGKSIIEAVKSLIDARVDYIYSLLLDCLPVPTPNCEKSDDAPKYTTPSFLPICSLVATYPIGISKNPPVSHPVNGDVRYYPYWDNHSKRWVYG